MLAVAVPAKAAILGQLPLSWAIHRKLSFILR